MALTTTKNLRGYTASGQPNIEGGEQRYLREEFKKIQDAIAQLVVAAQGLEQRLINGGL